MVFLVVSIIAVIAISYLLGSLNSAIIVSKLMYKDDIRRYGSGNAGLTNMLRTFGKKAAVFTLLGDILKTALAILIAAVFFGFHYRYGISVEYSFSACYIAGLFAVFGHIFPVYYRFKGGKGVLVTSTMALILTPIPFLILLAIFIAVVAASKYVSLGSVTVAVLYPVVANGYLGFIAMPTPAIMILCCIIAAVTIVWFHKENLKRIGNRTERKISFKSSKKQEIKETEEPSEDND